MNSLRSTRSVRFLAKKIAQHKLNLYQLGVILYLDGLASDLSLKQCRLQDGLGVIFFCAIKIKRRDRIEKEEEDKEDLIYRDGGGLPCVAGSR